MPCESDEHLFDPLGGAYYKEEKKREVGGFTPYDQSISYIMLFCRKCGKTKEVIEKDRRSKK